MEIVGCLMYIVNTCRPDAATATNMLGSYMTNPSPDHLTAAKGVLSYLYHTRNKGLVFKKRNVKGTTDMDKVSNMLLSGYFDSDFAGDKDKAFSRTGGLIYYNENLIKWVTTKQTITTFSVFEAETIAGCDVSKLLRFNRKIAAELSGTPKVMPKMMKLYGDNQRSIECASENKYGKRSKHFSVHHFGLQEASERRVVDLHHISSENNPADLMTKLVKKNIFEALVSRLVEDINVSSKALFVAYGE